MAAVPAAAAQVAAGMPSAATGARAAAVPGARLWVSRYNGPASGYDTATSVAAAAGRVFVTGGSERPGTAEDNNDYATVAYSAVTGRQLWVSRYNGPANKGDNAAAVAVSPDGSRVFVTGRSQTRKPSPEHEGALYSDYATVAYNAATGARLWVRRYNGPTGQEDDARAISVARDGRTVFVTGYSEGTTGADATTVAYGTATGAQLWVKRYNGAPHGYKFGVSVASPGNGRVYVAGVSLVSGRTGDDYLTLAYNSATGARVWARSYNGPGNGTDRISAMAVSPDRSKVIVTGRSANAAGRESFATVAYGAGSGRQLWVKRYSSPYRTHDAGANSVSVSPAGKVYVTGTSEGPAGQYDWDYTTIAYTTATGAQLWVRRYGPGTSVDGAAMVASPGNGKVYVTGTSYNNSRNSDYATVAYNAVTGVRLWVSRYNGPARGDDYASALALSPDRTKVFVTGSSSPSKSGPDFADYATIAYRS
jgi:WD40 repeat protein